MMRRSALLQALGAVALVAGGCRGCLPDDLTYEGSGGSATVTSSAVVGTATSTSASSSAASAGGDAFSIASASSAGGSAPAGAGGQGGSGAGDTGGGGAGGTEGTGGAGAGGAGTGGEGDGCPASDDFDDGLGPCWEQPENPLQAPLDETTPGVVSLEPGIGSSWFHNGEGTFYFQDVTGDFAVALAVDVDSRPGNYQLGGLMLRNPEDNVDEDWIRSDLGWVAAETRAAYITSTVDGASSVVSSAGHESGRETTTGVIGLCRRGSLVFAGWFRDGAWVVSDIPLDPDDDEIYPVPELDPTIEVGFTASRTDTGGLQEVIATFDAFRLDLGAGECAAALEGLWP